MNELKQFVTLRKNQSWRFFKANKGLLATIELHWTWTQTQSFTVWVDSLRNGNLFQNLYLLTPRNSQNLYFSAQHLSDETCNLQLEQFLFELIALFRCLDKQLCQFSSNFICTNCIAFHAISVELITSN